MMSKKDMLTLGVLAVGGVAVASSFAGGDGGGVLQPIKGRAGGILGSQQGYGAAPTIYNIPAAAPVTFPEAPTFDISKFLTPLVEPTVSRGAAGVSAAPKKQPVIYGGYKPSGASYVFGGAAFEQQAAKEIVSGGYSPTLGAAFGISPEIGGFMGTGMTQDAYKSQFAHRTYSTGAPAKKTSTDASKAVAHAKRLRAGRGD